VGVRIIQFAINSGGRNVKPIWIVFWVMVAVFVLVAATMFIPSIVGLPTRLNVFAGLPVFFLLGVALIVLTVKAKAGGMLKNFLLISGGSAVGLLVFSILHNVVSGLLHTEEPVFFILAVIVCPIAFLAGAIGSVYLAIKNKRVPQPS
jgi:hypothetical protein